MKKLTKNLIHFILKYSGLTTLIREFFQKDKTTIILYHDISEEVANKHFKYLIKKYNIIKLEDYISYRLGQTDWRPPPKSLIITIDDGYKNNYKLKELIMSYKIPLTIFLCAGLVNTSRNFWFKHLSSKDLNKKLKKMNNKERLQFLEKNGYNNLKEFEHRNALSKKEINELRSLVNFQSHSVSHPCLPNCSDEESSREIFESKKILEEDYDLDINTFSYPNGDYSQREIDILKKANYKAGITCDLSFNNNKTDIFRLKRIDIPDDASVLELESKITAVFPFFKRMLLKKYFGFKS
jgi:poly-beta-1,6-N-acetyl-D-glucosamine N-deacetylase